MQKMRTFLFGQTCLNYLIFWIIAIDWCSNDIGIADMHTSISQSIINP